MKDMQNRLDSLQKALNEKSDICISWGTISDFPSTLYEPFRTFGVGLIVCLRGNFSFSIVSERYEAHQGDTVFLSDDTVLCILDKSKDLEVQILFYRIDPIRNFLGNWVQQIQLYVKMSPTVYYVWNTHQEGELMKYMELLESTMSSEGNRFIYNERRLLLLSLTYHLCSIFQQKFLSQNSVSQRSSEIFLRLIGLIDNNYTTERGVRFYADKLCLSPKYLSELSKSVCGHTVHELIFKAIIRGVMAKLTSSTKTVQEIATEFHFPNSSSFGTFFKKQTGVSPQKFRIMNQVK